jgi:hypothetical protein
MNRTLAADDVQTVGEEREFEFGRVAQGALIAAGTAACLNLLVLAIPLTEVTPISSVAGAWTIIRGPCRSSKRGLRPRTRVESI